VREGENILKSLEKIETQVTDSTVNILAGSAPPWVDKDLSKQTGKTGKK